MKLIKKTIIITILAILFFSFETKEIEAAPGINKKITFQGKVVKKGVGDTDGTNVPDANYNFIFTLYSTLSAGTSLWSEVWDSGTTQVPVTSGIFTVAMGTHVTFPATVDFNTDNLYLAINFNGDGDMSPRVQFTAVPYALNAAKVAGLTVTNTTGTLTIPNGKTISFGDNFSTTGVGITLNQSLASGNSVTFAGLSIGGSVAFTNIAAGIGSSVLYLGSNGNLLVGTLPVITNSKVIRLSPEYSGASLSADGSASIGGTLTSDSVLNLGGNGWKNYYQWSSGVATLQDYSVITRIALPADFSSWETGACPSDTCALTVEYQTGVGSTVDNTFSFKINNDGDTPGSDVCSIGATASTVWSSQGCSSAVLNDGGAPEWDAAGEVAVIRLKMAAKSTASALSRIGDIILRYRSSF